MAIHARSDMTRPLTLGLIGLAITGWLFTFLLFIYRAEDQRDHRRQVRMMQANEAEVRGQLAQQTSASGTLSDLQASIAAAQQTRQRMPRRRYSASPSYKAKCSSSSSASSACETRLPRLSRPRWRVLKS